MLEFKNMDHIYQGVNETIPTKNGHKNSSGNFITIICVALFVILSLGMIIFLYNQNQSLKDKLSQYESLPSPTPIVIIATPSPIATSSASPVGKALKYSCPENGYVDCMPGTDIKSECSTEAINWYQENCPDFKGVAS